MISSPCRLMFAASVALSAAHSAVLCTDSDLALSAAFVRLSVHFSDEHRSPMELLLTPYFFASSRIDDPPIYSARIAFQFIRFSFSMGIAAPACGR